MTAPRRHADADATHTTRVEPLEHPVTPAPGCAPDVRSRGLTPAAVLALQRHSGNQAVTRMLARMPAAAFNPHSIAHDLQRAIDQSEVDDGWTMDGDGFHATTRKVDAEKVIALLDGLTHEQVVEVEELYKDKEGTTLENDLFKGGQSKHPSNLKPDARARIRALLRGTDAGEGKAKPDARLEADAAELHQLLSRNLGEAQRERAMALWRRPVAEIAAMDAISARVFSMHPAFVLPVRFQGLQLQRVLALRAGDAAKADALALEDKRRALDELKARKESGDMSILEQASYEGKRRKLVDGIGAIVEMNRHEALADKTNHDRTADQAVQAKLAKVLAARTQPSKTVGAALAETLQGNDAKAIAAPLVERAARKVLELEERHTMSTPKLAEVIHELRAAAQHDTQLELPKLVKNKRLLDPATTEDEFGKLVSERAGGYIKALIKTYDALKPADGRTWSAIVASADAGNREMLTALTETGGKLAPVDELHYAIGKRDAATIKQVLRGCGTQDGLRQLEADYQRKFRMDLRKAIFRTETAEQAMDSDAPIWTKTAAVRGRDAANVDELLNAPTQLGGSEEAARTAAGGMTEAAVTRENADTLGWLRELGTVPETQKIMNRSAGDLQLLHIKWLGASGNAQRQAQILAEMRQLRSALSGDAAAYEEENERLADQIRSAVSIAVQIGLAVALPGVGSGLPGFIATSAINIGATVASNAVIYGDKYDLDAILKDIEAGVLGALGGKLGEDVAKLIAVQVAERAGVAAVRAARAAGKTPKLAAELGQLAEEAARARASLRALAETANFTGAAGLTMAVTGDNGFTAEAVLQAFLIGRIAAKTARGKPAAHGDAHGAPARGAGSAPVHREGSAGRRRPEGTPSDGVPTPVQEQPTKPMKDPRNPFPEGTPPEGVPKTPDPDTPVTDGTPPEGVPKTPDPDAPVIEESPEGVPETPDPDAPVIEESPEGGFPDDGPAPEPEPEWQGPIEEVEIDLDNVTPTAGPEPVKAAGDGPHPPERTPPADVPTGDDGVPVPIHDPPSGPIKNPNHPPPDRTPPEGVPVPIPEQPTKPEGVPVPIPEQPTRPEGVPVPIPEQPTRPEGVPVPIPEQPTKPERVPVGDDAVPVPIHEQPTIPFPKGTPPEGVPVGDDAVPVPIHEQPTIPFPKGTPPHGVGPNSDGVPDHVNDQPSGFWNMPSDGVPKVTGGEPPQPARRQGEFPVREAATDDPDKTGRWQRPEDTIPDAPRPEDGGPGRVRAPSGVEPRVVTTLPDGSLVYGAPDRPFTLADADRVYLGLIDETPYREAQIIEDIDSGECIVIQGSTIDVKIDPAASASFLADRPWLTRWRTVRHNHPIGRGRVTPHSQRYPSVADMRGAEQQAHKNFRPQDELLDVATEHGRRSIPFGYDQMQKRPFWVGVPDASGVYRREWFSNVFEYQIWREQQFQGPA